MAEDDPYLSGSAAEVAVGSDTLLQTLKPKIHRAVQSKVDSILQDVQKFSDNDKLYLYLQLPVGLSAAEKSSLDVNSLSTAEHTRACNWIRNHLEEHTDTCLPKQDVYDTYKRYCDKLCCRPLSAANFGKIIREIFPNIKARRLGGRGQSKYCYSGIRRRTVVSMPTLPSLDLKITDSSEVTDVVQSYSIDVIEASCALICNWAEKILKRSFNNVVEVAQFLIQQHIISPRCASAELVMSMVVSEITDSVQRSQKQPAPSSKNNGLEGPESTSEAQKTEEKAVRVAISQQPAEKKKNSEGEKSASTPHMDALMARFPPLRPRIMSGEQAVGCCTLVQTSTPLLGPQLTSPPLGNSVQVAARPLLASTAPPLTMSSGVNGAGLVSLQKAVPVINVILPKVPAAAALPVSEIHFHPTGTSGEMGRAGQGGQTQTSHPPGVQGSLAKRPLEQPTPMETANEVAYKKRRGRPRKVIGEAVAEASSPPSDSETSGVALVEAPPRCYITPGEDSMEKTAEVAEQQHAHSVLKMGLPRASPEGDMPKSQAARANYSSGREEIESFRDVRFRSETMDLESGPLLSVGQDSGQSPHGSISSGSCQPMHSPSSGEGERSASHPSHSEHIPESRGSMVSDRTKGDMASAAPRVSESGPTSQVSVIQDGRHSMQRYMLGLAQEGENAKLRPVLGQKVVERIPSPASLTLAADRPREPEVGDFAQETSTAEPKARDPSAPSSTSVLSWGATASKAPRDPHGGFLHRSQTGH